MHTGGNWWIFLSLPTLLYKVSKTYPWMGILKNDKVEKLKEYEEEKRE